MIAVIVGFVYQIKIGKNYAAVATMGTARGHHKDRDVLSLSFRLCFLYLSMKRR
jgi:hypothetical protein